MFVPHPQVPLTSRLLRRCRPSHHTIVNHFSALTHRFTMSVPPRSLQVGVLAQPDYVFNPGAPVSRDLCILYYDQPYLRDIDVRRVFVIDQTSKTVLLTTPMRVMSAWWARQRAVQSAAASESPSASDSTPTPYLSVRGWQPAIDPLVAATYLNTLRSGHAGSLVSAAGIAAFYAVKSPPLSSPATADADAEAATSDDGLKKVMREIPIVGTSWLKFVVDFLSGVEAGASFIADSIDFDVPFSLAQEEKVTLLLKEEESDVAMGSPMFITDDVNGIVEGIQFRDGYGAKWDAAATHIPLRKPLYSPIHRPPAENRIWVFGGSAST